MRVSLFPGWGRFSGWGMPGLLCTALCLASAPAWGKTSVVVGKDGSLNVPEGSPLRTRLEVQPVQVVVPKDTLSVPGAIVAEPARHVSIFAPVVGRIMTLSVVPGQHVRQGDTLAMLSTGDTAQASTDEEKAHAGLVLAQKALARAQQVRQAGGAATRDVEVAQAALAQAQAEERRAQARLAALDDSVGEGGKLVLRSPVNGVVSAVNMAPGQNVTDVTAPLLSVEDLSEVWVVADVAEAGADQIHVGQAVSLTLPARDGVVLYGEIAAVEPDLRPDTRRVRAMIPLPNPDENLRPNMFATVNVQLKQPPGLMVPQSALLMNNDNVTVFVETAPWTFMRRKVGISYDEGEDTRVLSGLSAGDRIVTRGGVLLNDD
ncbi:efflux RND transporter periplasmic adaptor subunit [Acetobacter farinalis]|uniref:Efflux RND transporter periplasmic adaptor subunit n=1 Tax=Acetobacter farinalis TaxID=1260984 RepID=A0ABT3Q5B7_9PROT|nr:efflux RND transporter periplasmic adaptor subunit [Acetobacter farinalis]MCX2560475.1 efflux RND transporter periplasmic adaptor subunit [Acetobacter farinalis]NHO29382.1 efflux RND transporter periplasmic adaptor subunit [Acetobacter farinalis]